MGVQVAQRVVQQTVDDITGKDIVEGQGETVRFAVNGMEYEIDLDDKNAKKFHDALAFYIDHGRKVGRGNDPPRPRGWPVGLAGLRPCGGAEVGGVQRVHGESAWADQGRGPRRLPGGGELTQSTGGSARRRHSLGEAAVSAFAGARSGVRL